MTTQSAIVVSVLAVVLFLGEGCRRREVQHAVEAQMASSIIDVLQIYEIEEPGRRLTNLAQFYDNDKRRYPYVWQERFRQFGKDAGFNNSIFEKHVFLPPGITNRHVQGELRVINAQPFPDPEGKGRIIISSLGTGHGAYRRRWYPEDVVQVIIAEAGVTIPAQPQMSAPPPAPVETNPTFMETKEPLFSIVRGIVLVFLQAYGMSGFAAWSVWIALCSVLFVAFVVTAFMLWKRKVK